MCGTCKAVNEGHHPGPKPDHSRKPTTPYRPKKAERRAKLPPIEDAEPGKDLDLADPGSLVIKDVPNVGRHLTNKLEHEAKREVLMAQVLQLHLMGYSLTDIAKRLGLAYQTVHKYRREALQRVLMPQVEEWRRTWIMRLEVAAQAALRDLNDADPETRHKAIASVTKLADRASRMLGLDAPKQITVDGTFTELSEADRAFAEMLREEAARNAVERAEAPSEG